MAIGEGNTSLLREMMQAVDPREGSKLDADMVPEELPLPRFAQPAKGGPDDEEDLGDSSEEENEDKGTGSEQKGYVCVSSFHVEGWAGCD